MNNYSSNNSNNNIKEKTSYFDKLGANNVNIFSQLKQTKYSIRQKTNNKNSTNHIRSSSVLNIKTTTIKTIQMITTNTTLTNLKPQR